jgi:hypothetical protein
MLHFRRTFVGVLVALLAGAFAAQAKTAHSADGGSRVPARDDLPPVVMGEEKPDLFLGHDRPEGPGESLALDARIFRIGHLADFSFPVCDALWRLNVKEASRSMAARAPPAPKL